MITSLTTPGLLSTCRTAFVATCAGVLAIGGVAFATAQDATPSSTARSSISAVGMMNVDGLQIGTVSASESDGAVTFTITASTLTPGEHGIHVHETGSCDPATGFESAGGHFNPDQHPHGPGAATLEAQIQEPEEGAATPAVSAPAAASPVSGAESHAGDLGNLIVDETGSVTVNVTTSSVTLAPDTATSLADADGSALVIHADTDDLATDPSGNSGERIACAVLFAPADEAGAAASPAVDGAADAPAAATVTLEALDALKFAPETLTVSPGDTITASNPGVIEHNFVVDELGILVDLPNGGSTEITIPADAAPGEYRFYCSIPGHEPAGMVGTLIIQ